MCELVNTAEKRRLRRRNQVLVSSLLVMYITTSQASLRLPHGPLRLALSAIAGASFFGELVAAASFMVSMRDEFQRGLLIKSFLWATVITMGLVFVWGFVELSLRDAAPHIPLLAIPAVLIVITAAAKVFFFRQHKSPAL